MTRVRLRVLLLITANLPLLYAELSRNEEPSAISGRDKAKSAFCDKGTDHNHEVLTFWLKFRLRGPHPEKKPARAKVPTIL